MNRFLCLIVALSLNTTFAFPSTPAASKSGGWVSGGGELVRDAQNPWFVQNTERVNYCIEVDPEHFHADRDMIGEKVKAALDLWQKEFTYVERPKPPMKTINIRVGTQFFSEVDCGQDVDVRFQFGTLTKEQQERIDDPRRFVSLAVRTEYDPVNMRGKGFVYLAADSGPLRPDSANMFREPWKAGNVLYAILIHEIGHIFGVPHVGNGLMGANFPAAVTSGGISPFDNYGTKNFHFFSPSDMTFIARFRSLEKYQQFFGTSVQASEILFRFQSDQLEVSEYNGGNRAVLIGTAKLKAAKASPVLMSIKLYLPPEQKVLLYVHESGVYEVALQKVQNRTGLYKSVDGRVERPIFVTLPSDASEVSFMGVLDGELIPDLLDYQLAPVRSL